MDRITIARIIVHGKHGANPGERDRSQPFHVNVELDVDLRKAGESDDLADTVNYAQVYETVRKVVEDRSYVLVERVAAEILNELFAEPRIVRASVSIAKPDLLDGATPSVCLTRENPRH